MFSRILASLLHTLSNYYYYYYYLFIFLLLLLLLLLLPVHPLNHTYMHISDEDEDREAGINLLTGIEDNEIYYEDGDAVFEEQVSGNGNIQANPYDDNVVSARLRACNY